MASGRNTRIDGRRSSSYCSTATIAVFIALCFVGIWMMTSTTVVPVEVPTPDSNAEVKDQVLDAKNSVEKTPVQETNPGSFEDNQGDLPEDARKGDSEENTNPSGDETKTQPSPKKIESKVDASIEEDVIIAKGSKEVPKNKSGMKTNQDKEFTDSESSALQETNQESEKITTNESTNEKKLDETVISEEERQSSGTLQQPDDSEGGQRETSEGEKLPSDDSRLVQSEENVDGKPNKGSKQSSIGKGMPEVFPNGAQSDLLNETSTKSFTWSTQASESTKEKQAQVSANSKGDVELISWKLCNTSAGADYIPCLDNWAAIKKLRTTKHYEHRERHCPESAPTCLVPLPNGYSRPIKWPDSRNKIWYKNVPHTELAAVKGHQNWVKVSGEFLTFPGGGTQFIKGALHYIDNIQEALPVIEWGKQSRVVLDVGCGVASFGGYLFDRDTVTMSFAPKDEHEAQVQFALERGIPSISAVMGTKRLPFPGMVFDVIHCARCRVPWHIEDGKLLLELNRLLRPGGYFVWSATPVYQKLEEDVQIWTAMSELTKSMCWDLVVKTGDKVNKVGLAIYKKPLDNTCYDKRKEDTPAFCPSSDDPNAAWNVPLQACMHRLPVDPACRGWEWPAKWPSRLEKTPYWLNNSQLGVYGKPAPEDFQADYEHWKRVVGNSYKAGMGIDWSNVRNVMDMRAVYGGFAAALRDMKVWVMNVVNIDSPDTLPIIYERGLFGIYHDWCESFSTYPRTYDLLHADHLFSKINNRCSLLSLMAEVDRILRPDGNLVVRDLSETLVEIESVAKSLHWEIQLTFSKDNLGILCLKKTKWRPVQGEIAQKLTP